MMLFGLALLFATAVGLLCVRSAPALARWFAWCTAIAFAAAGGQLLQVEFVSSPTTRGTVAVVDAGQRARTDLLRVAAQVGPRANDLVLVWQQELLHDVGSGPLGAVAAAPPALPFAPEDLQVRCLNRAVVGRPVLLQVELPSAARPFVVEVVVSVDGREVHRQEVQAGDAASAEFSFTPTIAGRHAMQLTGDVGGHRLRGVGAFDIGRPATVLVIESGTGLAAALGAQGVAAVAAASLPADWRQHAAIVLGSPVSVAEQGELVTAVLDGLGLFVLAPAFGGSTDALRALLPLRVLPAAETASDGDASSIGLGIEAAPTPPPEAPGELPSGDTSGAGPISKEPIEVDKHTIAMVLVVDRSGSMGQRVANGETKMSYAKTSALRTAQALGVGDQVAIVTFGNKEAGRVELPMTDASLGSEVRAGVEKLTHASEFTYLLAGLRRARELLAPVRVAVKHVVVISDGEFDVGEELALRAEAFGMRSQDKVTLSVISIVDEQTSPQFEKVAALLASEGGGQFFAASDISSVPALVSSEVTRALQSIGRKPQLGAGSSTASSPRPPKPADERPAPRTSPSSPNPSRPRLRMVAVAESSLLQPVPADWPTLGGATPGLATLDAQVLLAIQNEAGWPLLAFANRGLGRVGAFAADLVGDDGAEFRRESAFPARLSQWVQSVLPAEVATSRGIIEHCEVSPPAPTPEEIVMLQQLSGTAPVLVEAIPIAGHAWRRHVGGAAGAWAPWLLAAVVLLAAVERLLLRGWRS